MRIDLDHRLLLSRAPKTLASLRGLLQDLLGSPHQLVIDGGVEGERSWELWCASDRLGRYYTRIIGLSQASRTFQTRPDIVLRVSDEEREEVSLDGTHAVASLARARKLIAKPLQLWLENDRNDRDFLLTVTPPGPSREFLEQALRDEWIECRHGGGSDLGKKLLELDRWQRLRAWAMCDADTWQPSDTSSQVTAFHRAAQGFVGERPNRKARARRTPTAPSMPLEVLSRRAIENYLPPRALTRWATRRHRNNYEQRQRQKHFAAAVKDLDEYADTPFNLRHHYHFEKGFSSEPEKIPPAYAPFRDVSALAKGIGNPIKKIYAENISIRDQAGATLFEDAWFANDEGLHTEITRILDSIRRRL